LGSAASPTAGRALLQTLPARSNLPALQRTPPLLPDGLTLAAPSSLALPTSSARTCHRHGLPLLGAPPQHPAAQWGLPCGPAPVPRRTSCPASSPRARRGCRPQAGGSAGPGPPLQGVMRARVCACARACVCVRAHTYTYAPLVGGAATKCRSAAVRNDSTPPSLPATDAYSRARRAAVLMLPRELVLLVWAAWTC